MQAIFIGMSAALMHGDECRASTGCRSAVRAALRLHGHHPCILIHRRAVALRERRAI